MEWEHDFRGRVEAWHARLVRWMSCKGFDYKINSVQKFFQLFCHEKKFDIGAFVSPRVAPRAPLASDYAHPPWTVSDVKLREMFLAELGECANLYFQREKEKELARRQTPEDSIADACREWMRKATLDELTRLPCVATSPLLGVYDPTRDRIFSGINPLVWHLRSLRHCLAIVLQERIKSKDWTELPGDIDVDEERREIAKTLNTEIERLLKPTPKRIVQRCQAEFVRFVTEEVPRVSLDEKGEQKQTRAIADRLMSWYQERIDETNDEYSKAMSSENWDRIGQYLTALGAHALIGRVYVVAQMLEPGDAFGDLARRVRDEWKPAEHKFTATLKLSGVSDICNRNASYEAIRQSLAWIIGTDDDRKGTRDMTTKDVYAKLLDSTDRLVFADISPGTSARDRVMKQLQKKTADVSDHVIEKTRWFIDVVRDMREERQKIYRRSGYLVQRAKDTCRVNCDVLRDNRRVPLSDDLMDVLRELLGSSNLQDIDSQLRNLVQDLIPDVRISSITDWAAATFAVVDRRVSPDDEKTPLSTSELIDIYVSQLLCVNRLSLNKELEDHECP